MPRDDGPAARWNRHDLILRVSDAYFRLLATLDNREVARLQKISIKRQMDLASERRVV